MHASPTGHAASADDSNALDWTRRLVAIDTTSRVSNLGLIETVRDHLRQRGLQPLLSYNPGADKANLFATVPASDGRIDGGLVLSGHTDVVPVDGQDWDSDPFRPEIRDGRLYGRGTCDMKGFIGTTLALLPWLQSQRLRAPVHFALSFDEELGCLGAPVMLADLHDRGIRPSGCIVGEPTGMRPVVAHKGINAYRCCVRGRAAHSSLAPRGVNAIEYAARLICFIRDLADEYRVRGPYDEAFDIGCSTAQTGTIAGGIAVNTIPAHCEFTFEFRNLPGVDPEAIYERIRVHADEVLLPQMRAEHPDAGLVIERTATAPAFNAADEAALTQLMRALTRDHRARKVAYATEAGLFQAAGVPSVVCGPGEIEQAHRANEFVELAQLAQCEALLRAVVETAVCQP